MKRNSYNNILANLDARTTYNSWNNKPVRKLNCVAEVTVRTSEHVHTDKIYKPTREQIEKVVRNIYASALEDIKRHNKWVDKHNAHTIEIAKEFGHEPWLTDYEVFEGFEVHAVDRDNIEWTITVE